MMKPRNIFRTVYLRYNFARQLSTPEKIPSAKVGEVGAAVSILLDCDTQILSTICVPRGTYIYVTSRKRMFLAVTR